MLYVLLMLIKKEVYILIILLSKAKQILHAAAFDCFQSAYNIHNSLEITEHFEFIFFLCLKLSVNILFYVRVIFLILPYSVVFFFVYSQYGTLYKSLPFFLWCMTVRNADFFFFLITLSLRKTILMFTTIKHVNE